MQPIASSLCCQPAARRKASRDLRPIPVLLIQSLSVTAARLCSDVGETIVTHLDGVEKSMIIWVVMLVRGSIKGSRRRHFRATILMWLGAPKFSSSGLPSMTTIIPHHIERGYKNPNLDKIGHRSRGSSCYTVCVFEEHQHRTGNHRALTLFIIIYTRLNSSPSVIRS